VHHYELQRPPSEAEWASITKDVRKILGASPVRIVGGSGETNSVPEISEDRIVFNGLEDSGYETFALLRDVEGFGFCKTGFSEIKKYDLIVKATLIAAYDRAPGCFRITSDGFDFEWMGARAFASEVLDRKLTLPPLVEANATMKPEYRTGKLYERARDAYFAARYKGGAGPDLWRYGNYLGEGGS